MYCDRAYPLPQGQPLHINITIDNYNLILMKRFIVLAALFAILSGHSQTKRIDSLAIQLAFQKKDSVKVDTSIELIQALYKTKEYQKALLYISETEQLSTALHYLKGIAEANYFKALIYASKNDYYNAIDHFNKSKQLFTELKDALGTAKVFNSIGFLEIKRGNYRSGLIHSLSAISTFESNNLYNDLSLAYDNLAEAYLQTHQIDKALEFTIKSLNIKERLRDSVGIKTTTKNIALLYSKRKEHRKAIENYEAVLAMLDLDHDQSLRGEILPRLGEEYLKFKEDAKAETYLTEGLQYNRKIKNNEGILRALNSNAHLNLKRRYTRLAENQIYEAHKLALNTGNDEELLKNYRLLMALDSTKGKFQNAYNWQREYFNLKNQLDQEDWLQLPTDTDSDEDLFKSKDTLIAKNVQVISNTSENIDKVQQLRFISYGLLAAFITALTFLLLIFLRRKSSIRYTRELEEKNEEILRQNEAIMEQKQHLEEINKVKDRLFSIVSHDLKDSISSIKGFLDLLKEDSISKEEFDELIPDLSENANNASLLLFNLLNWSKSQMQNLEPKPALCDIQKIFHSKIPLIEQKMEQKRISLIDNSQSEFIYADKSMIEIVVQNLLTNAVKFSQEGDVITISNKEHHGKSLICVEDTGVGISKENLSKLFLNNNFSTIGTHNEKGTGLGLTICKELVVLNQGRIWVESTPNIGTKFYIELPKIKME